jgi:hypothetical protein
MFRSFCLQKQAKALGFMRFMLNIHRAGGKGLGCNIFAADVLGPSLFENMIGLMVRGLC